MLILGIVIFILSFLGLIISRNKKLMLRLAFFLSDEKIEDFQPIQEPPKPEGKKVLRLSFNDGGVWGWNPHFNSLEVYGDDLGDFLANYRGRIVEIGSNEDLEDCCEDHQRRILSQQKRLEKIIVCPEYYFDGTLDDLFSFFTERHIQFWSKEKGLELASRGEIKRWVQKKSVLVVGRPEIKDLKDHIGTFYGFILHPKGNKITLL